MCAFVGGGGDDSEIGLAVCMIASMCIFALLSYLNIYFMFWSISLRSFVTILFFAKMQLFFDFICIRTNFICHLKYWVHLYIFSL